MAGLGWHSEWRRTNARRLDDDKPRHSRDDIARQGAKHEEFRLAILGDYARSLGALKNERGGLEARPYVGIESYTTAGIRSSMELGSAPTPVCERTAISGYMA